MRDPVSIDVALTLHLSASNHDFLTGEDQYRFDVRINGLSTMVVLVVLAGSREDAQRVALEKAPAEVRRALQRGAQIVTVE